VLEGRFFALKDAHQWPIAYNSDHMGQEVVLELPDHHENCVEQLLSLRVPCLSILQDLTNKIHGLLFDFCGGFWPFNDDNGADYCIGGCNV
jgi:hypothetical protein